MARKPADSLHDRFGESILLRFDKAEQAHPLPAQLTVEAATIRPLKLEPRGMWDPTEEYWGEEGEPVEEWAKAIITKGPRPLFEMEQILPDNLGVRFVLPRVRARRKWTPTSSRRGISSVRSARNETPLT